MAVVTLYFGTSSAGAADGTSWDNRDVFVSGGAINTRISAFDFTSDTLIARIGPGTHTLTTGIATFTGTTTPSQTFPCILEGALSDGTRWQPPDPDWVSAQPAWDADDATYPMPVIATTTNIGTVNHASVVLYGLKFTASGRFGDIIQGYRSATWVQGIQDSNHVAANCAGGSPVYLTNCHFECNGASYTSVGSFAPQTRVTNIRLKGNLSATTGNRRGYSMSNNATYMYSDLTIINNPGGGFILAATTSSARINLTGFTIVDNSGDAISSAATSTVLGLIENGFISGTHTNGINITGSGDYFVSNCRIRDYTAVAVTGNLDWSDPPLNDNVITSGTDADEYVDAVGGDYRIKNTSVYWGKGYGAGDEPPAGGTTVSPSLHPLAYTGRR